MRTKKAALVINPRTGQNVIKLPNVLAVLSAAGWKIDTLLKEYGGHTMELANAAAEEEADMVIAYGGDGTVSQIVNGVMNDKKQKSVVAVIPGGTANLWAGDIGVPSDPVQAVLSLIDSEVRKIDVGRVDIHEITYPDGHQVKFSGKKGKANSMGSSGARRYFLLMAGLGLDAAVMGAVSKPLKYRIGSLAVGLSAAKEIPAQPVYPVEIWSEGDGDEGPTLWKGDSLQVVIGNTRRYAIVLKMTPDAYIDDGKLDVCVITGGDPLSTVQQLTSLILRRKPDNVNAEFFRDASLYIKVPASVPLELDGTCVKLKDYMDKKDYAELEQAGDLEQATVTYRFSAVPKSLRMAIPHTYDDELFEHSNGNGHDKNAESQALDEGRAKAHVGVQPREVGEKEQTEAQRQAIAVETRPKHSEDDEHPSEQPEQALQTSQEFSEQINKVLESGRKVTVIGKVADPRKSHTYIIAGDVARPISNDTRPCAVVVDEKTTIFGRDGKNVGLEAVEELQQNDVVVVEGSKSKRGVIRAKSIVL
jgi:diacylglycerol kinase family enzyme